MNVRIGASAGFTLVEMMIALSIFGLLTAAGVTLLGLTARTQEASDRLLGELGELRRTGALLTADLAQAAPRLYRDRDGRPLRAFAGGNGEEPMLMAFVRRGWAGGDGAALQRVAWRLRDARLERLSYPHVDGGGSPVAVTLLDGVSGLRLRYRDDEGMWHDRWDPANGSHLPRAVEMVTTSQPHGTVRQLFLVGTGSP
ncbi:type II secretion system minor pseudopilin GspJ [Sphingosinicella sp. CPCC 101087]|uniref:type II secretion system minor pseudopilin GspJ n=1 Tax=Sphingosinicella sp. CPCC 101087 TaxID=2497754 RepID=UPI001FB08447|nr:type II secretion system minor pseudopilin GspJ [Sphingosinicella sp. CPCC 101087]